MSIKEGAAEKRLSEQLRRRGIALSADEFMQVIADALDDVSDPAQGRRQRCIGSGADDG